GNIYGAAIGGLVLGLIRTFWDGYFDSAWSDVVIFAILIMVLVFRPTGILGMRVPEKRRDRLVPARVGERSAVGPERRRLLPPRDLRGPLPLLRERRDRRQPKLPALGRRRRRRLRAAHARAQCRRRHGWAARPWLRGVLRDRRVHVRVHRERSSRGHAAADDPTCPVLDRSAHRPVRRRVVRRHPRRADPATAR